MSGDLARITQALAFPDEAARAHAAERLLARAATVESVLGRPVAWKEAAQAFTAAFREALDLDLQPLDLTRAEKERSEELVESKYAHPQWTERATGFKAKS